MSKKESFRTEIRLSGSGGQGLMLAGHILADASVIDGYRVTLSKSYGPESRGGASRTDVIISDEEIYYPEATRFDCLLALMQEACDKYVYDVKTKGILIVDTTHVKNVSVMNTKVYELPFTNIAKEKLGSVLPTNILTLSFLVKITKAVSLESLEQAIRETVKPAFVDLNIKAMNLGYELADNYEK